LEVTLSPELARRIREKVETGMYDSPDEVVDAALRLLDDHDMNRARQLESLRREIAIGIEAADRGQVTEYDDESLKAFFASIKQEGRARLSGEREKSGE
jgi:antitoxin ParD1/3/4